MTDAGGTEQDPGRHPDEYFRAGAGAVVLHPTEPKVLVLKRVKQPDHWQLPQGGLEPGEEPEAAARRELAEETGLRAPDVEFLDSLPGWLAYELPPEARSAKTGRGQAHRWFIFRLKNEDAVNLRATRLPEFSEWKWSNVNSIVDEAVNFRRPVYRELQRHLRHFLLIDDGSRPPTTETTD